MVRHKKGYSTVVILIVGILFITAAVIHQSSTIQTAAYHQTSVQVLPKSRKQSNSVANKFKGPNFSSPTIFSPSTIPNPTATQQIPTIVPTELLKQ